MKATTAPKDDSTTGKAKTGAPAMMNQVTVIGRTCTAIQLRQTNNGVAGSIRLAVPGRGGKTNFFTANFWNDSAQTAERFLTAPLGRLIAITGSLVSTRWLAKDGSAREQVAINVDRFYFLDRPTQKEVA
jgi:single-stranded DNA-binding protein